MDLPGNLRLFLQSCLFRKYLNYSDWATFNGVCGGKADMQVYIDQVLGFKDQVLGLQRRLW